MKKILFVSMLLLLGGCSLFAQSGITNDAVHGGVNGIVRTEGTITLSYYELRNGFFSDISDISGTFHTVELPEGWHVRDFRIKNDTAYFCGELKNDGGALFGYFCITPLLSGYGSIQIYHDANISSVFSKLNRIAVASDKKRVAIMAIGTSVGNIDDPDITGSDKLLYYETFPNTSVVYEPGDSELFWDVCVADGYFASIGTKGLHSSIVTLHRGDFNTGVFSSVPSFFERVNHCILGQDYLISGFRSTAIENAQMVAAAYYGNSNVRGTYYFTFDVPTAAVTNSQKTFFNSTLSYELYPPRDMAYLADSGVLMVVETSPFLSYTGALQIDPFASTLPFYVPQYYFKVNNMIPEEIGFRSIAAQSPNTFLVTSGKEWMKLVLDGSLPPVHYFYPSICIGTFTTDVFPQGLQLSESVMAGQVGQYSPEFYVTDKVSGTVTIYPCRQ